jgi:hypothetical protein
MVKRGNLASKANKDYTYDSEHPHAASTFNGNQYQYDENGSQTTRVINGETFNLYYDADIVPSGKIAW